MGLERIDILRTAFLPSKFLFWGNPSFWGTTPYFSVAFRGEERRFLAL